jgi:hypothetical protein
MERSLYDLSVSTISGDKNDVERRSNMTQTDAAEFFKSVIRSSEYGKSVTIIVTRKIPS